MSEPEKTPDGHHVIIDGRRWRATDPRLSEEERQRHVDELMAARRDVGAGKRADDEDAVKAARARVHAAKVALGERGPKWWEDDEKSPSPDDGCNPESSTGSAGEDGPAGTEGDAPHDPPATADEHHDAPST